MASHTEEAREQALTQLMHTYGDSIKRMCCVYLKDLGVAEDAAQETFIKAYAHIDEVIDGAIANERAWLSRIAINTCKDYRRTAWFRHVDLRQALDELPPRLLFTSTEDRSLTLAVMELPTRYKQVILLYYYEGFTQTEIAETLHVSNATVHRRLEKAYGLLKKELKGGSIYEV